LVPFFWASKKKAHARQGGKSINAIGVA